MSSGDVLTSKNARIYAWLRAEFEAGRIVAGGRLPSENELCVRFGASRPAVRQAVARLIHEGAVRTVRGSGSFRSQPPANDSRDIALVLPALSSYIYPELVEAANASLREAGFQTLLDCTGGDPAVERSILLSLKDRRPAGIIISPWQGNLPGMDADMDARMNLSLLKDLRSAGIAVFLLDNELGEGSFSSLVIDDLAGGAAAADFFLARGLGDAAVAWKPGHAPFLSRRDGFLRRMAAVSPAGAVLSTAGAAAARNSLSVPLTGAGGASSALDAAYGAGWGAAGKAGTSGLPRAFFCTNDVLALAMAEALGGRGLRVPEDVAIVGFDDSSLARSRGLTSFSYPSRWIGSRAAALVREALADSSTRSATRIVIDPELIERNTTP